MSNREEYDEEIEANDLKVGDRIHLTVMGGDEYFTIDEIRKQIVEKTKGVVVENVYWHGTGVAYMEDTVSPDAKVWIKKRNT